VTEDHRANCKNGRADPNDQGGFLLGNDWRRFHHKKEPRRDHFVPLREKPPASMGLWTRFDFASKLRVSQSPLLLVVAFGA
jgi:hypothetical protein